MPPEEGRRQWRRGGWATGERPPWWPQGEAWPPTGPPERWRHMRGGFVRRAAVAAFVAFLVFAFVVASFVTVLLSMFNSATAGGGLFLAALAVIVVAFGFARGLRRLVAPLGDLIEAAESVEAGSYGTRVRPRGPRELRALARAFNAMSERLETSEEQRRRLLADVTHELRTPLTIMQGNLEALLDGVHPADAEHLDPILDETRVLSRLVDDLRTLSLAEAGALTLHREPTDVGELLADAVASFRTQADGAGITLVTTIDGALPHVELDPVRMREVLSNLLSNALRYTPRGGTVRVGGAAEIGQVRLIVRDSGPGIPAELLPHVFDRFYKSEDSRGAGLGLAIAKSLVVAHGGQIEASSAPGQGAEMRITLPVAEAKPS
ncbi:MAG TPA: ATP-binding protein [Candidatus Limnocylindria bacterium]|nr:ATP-binding protein [Candidatus Limnocylindria bacterium]